MKDPKRPLKYLADILFSIDLLEDYAGMVPDEVTLADDQEKIDAIERRFGIIGEALYQLQRLEVKLPHRDWAINFRSCGTSGMTYRRCGGRWKKRWMRLKAHPMTDLILKRLTAFGMGIAALSLF